LEAERIRIGFRWWFCEKREDEHQMLVVKCSLACLELRGDHDKMDCSRSSRPVYSRDRSLAFIAVGVARNPAEAEAPNLSSFEVQYNVYNIKCLL
jgi:hypothetical protein